MISKKKQSLCQWKGIRTKPLIGLSYNKFFLSYIQVKDGRSPVLSGIFTRCKEVSQRELVRAGAADRCRQMVAAFMKHEIPLFFD